MMNKIRHIVLFLLVINPLFLFAEDGYDLWLRYKAVSNPTLLANYQKQITSFFIPGKSPTLDVVRNELTTGLAGLLKKPVKEQNQLQNGCLFLVQIRDLHIFPDLKPSGNFSDSIRTDGFFIYSFNHKSKKITVILAKEDLGLLYGTFHFLRLLQTEQPVNTLRILCNPQLKIRMLDHWDNLDRHVERGYAGISIWNWHTLPGYIDKRYVDYAKANASIGINSVSLTNVNANAMVLTPLYLEKVKALADVFRPYGIRVFLTARFSAPIEIGKLGTADPLNDTVRNWWRDKAKEIYAMIPDFGGFLVKANSEGQPGPQNYGRTHADGANMLADAVAPFNGIVMWRAFVYSQQSDDRFKQAYDEFKPLDGKFRKNVMVQVKNGPIDFQPREPFSPLFGSMPNTPLVMEFQLTQEYLGQGTHLVYQAPLYKEVLDADTYAKGKGSTVTKVIDGSLYNHELTGMAGVSNIGNERNWTGHLFGQSNWYALGRLAWDPSLSAEKIAGEWIRQTFSNNPLAVKQITTIMLMSRETLVDYMTPLGLHHIMGNGHHYGPAPWSDNLPRPDWNPVYYHKADVAGIGFDRTASGSNAVSQYKPEVKQQYEDISNEKYLLWFNHVPWEQKMKSGRILWDELCFKYYTGVDQVRTMQKVWDNLAKQIDIDRFRQVQMLMGIQVKEAIWWRNACLLYFQTFSKMPIPSNYEQPDKTLDYYKSLRFPYAPGN